VKQLPPGAALRAIICRWEGAFLSASCSSPGFEQTGSTRCGLCGAVGQREEMQVRHREVLSIVGQERDSVGQGDGGDSHAGVGKSVAFPLPVAA